MSVRIGSILGAVVAGMAFQATAFGGIVFDNSVSNNQGITTASLPQLGDEVTAAGTLRTVTELDIGVTSQGGGGQRRQPISKRFFMPTTVPAARGILCGELPRPLRSEPQHGERADFI